MNLIRSASLRSRIIMSLVIIFIVTSILFATGVVLIQRWLEEIILGNMVREQLDVVAEQLEDGRYMSGTLYNNWAFYYPGQMDGLAPEIRELPPGSWHRVRVEDSFYQVEIAEQKGMKLVMTYDITEWENREDELYKTLSWSIGLVMIAAVLMGWQASRTILAPVRALTQRLTTIHPNQRNVRIAEEFSGNEIGLIAAEFDRYLERLDQFVQRERSFTAAASHELRTPLSVMLGAVDVLETRQHDPSSKRALARIRRACTEMKGFIEATLFLSREESTTIREEGPADLTNVVDNVIEDNHSLIKQKNITVEKHFHNQISLNVPASIIAISFSNILRNAVEHTSNGTITITIKGNTLTVKDTGTGIAEENLTRIFEHSFTTKPEGTGMGLNLVRRICDRFGWAVSIQSKLKEGTTVSLTFNNEYGAALSGSNNPADIYNQPAQPL